MRATVGLIAQMQALGMTAHAALTDSAVAIAVGEDSESDLTSMLTKEAGEMTPFMSFSMDAGRYYAFLGEAIAQSEATDDEKAPSPEMQAALQDIMTAVGSLYDRMSADVMLTADGVELRVTETLAD